MIAGALAFLLLLAGELGAAEYRHRDGRLLPDRRATPGHVRTDDVAVFCTPGTAAAARDVSAATKRHVHARYAVDPDRRPCPCHIDHLVPLSMGGSNDLRNLWPLPVDQKRREKDVVESFLRRAVCGGAIDLERARQDLTADWWAAYQRMKRGGYP